MKHTMIDCYGSKNHSLENLVYINDTLNKIAYNFFMFFCLYGFKILSSISFCCN